VQSLGRLAAVSNEFTDARVTLERLRRKDHTFQEGKFWPRARARLGELSKDGERDIRGEGIQLGQ